MTANRWKRAGAAVTKSIVVLLTATAVLLTFFLLQSKLTDSEPAVFGHKIYIVMSGSMEPAVALGSLVAVRPLPAKEVAPGDIITYRSEHSGSLTTHRVAELETDTDNGLLFYTKGDANNARDPLPAKARQLVGKVVLTVPYAGYLFAYTRTGQGQLVLFGLAALVVVAELVRTQLAEKQLRHKNDGEEVEQKTAPNSRQA